MSEQFDPAAAERVRALVAAAPPVEADQFPNEMMEKGKAAADYEYAADLRVANKVDPSPAREELAAAEGVLSVKRTGKYTAEHERIITGVIRPTVRKSMLE